MGCVRVEASDFARWMGILKRIIGRSERPFRFVQIGDSWIKAWDGCAGVKIVAPFDFPPISLPSDALASLSRICRGEMVICRREQLTLECEDVRVIAKDLKLRLEEPVAGEEMGEAEDLIEGLDFVSKGLSEGDSLELHMGKRPLIYASITGISALYILDGYGKKFSFSIPYQSARRIVKALEGMKGWKLWAGKSLVFSRGDIEGFVCGDVLKETVAISRIGEWRELDETFKKAISRAADILKSEAVISVKDGEIVIRGKREGMELEIRERIEEDADLKFVASLKGLRSYLSRMGKIRYSKGGGMVRFSDGKGKRYVVVKEAL